MGLAVSSAWSMSFQAKRANHAVDLGVAAPRPECIERKVVGGPQWVVGRTHHGAERRMRQAAELAGVRFALIEERVPQALAAIGRQQHGFSAIEQPGDVVALGGQRRGELALHLGQRRRGGAADDLIAVEGRDDHRARRGGELAQIGLLVIERAIVEIGPAAKHGDAQPRQGRQAARQRFPGQRLDAHRHAASSPATCSSQSVRL